MQKEAKNRQKRWGKGVDEIESGLGCPKRVGGCTVRTGRCPMAMVTPIAIVVLHIG